MQYDAPAFKDEVSLMNEIFLDDFEEPNPNCKFNYLLDTAAFNRFAEHREWIDLAEKSLELGFHYYKTANQDYELSGRGAKTYDANCVPHVKITDSFREKMLIFDEVLKRLKVKRLSSIASLMTNHWVLDGTHRVLDDKSKVGQMTKEILQFDEKTKIEKPFVQHYDAMSAEAAMYHGCVLVSDDKKLRDMVNKYFPQKAIQTKALIDFIRDQLRQ